MIKPYLSNIINNNKTKGEWKVHSGDTAISYKTQIEWIFQLKLHSHVRIFLHKDLRKVLT